MKKVLICFGLATVMLSSCSLLQRNTEDLEAEANRPPFDPAESRETAESLSGTPGSYEAEISRLNTKVSALETKLDVLSASMERTQLKSSQPIIEAEAPSPQTTMAAPVEESPVEEQVTPHVSAAPVRPISELPAQTKLSVARPAGSEKEFRTAMEFFQAGKNLEAASRFSSFTKKYPHHLLASHALYWSGEASARAQQWSQALESWEELERQYPRSAYIPEALAGLAKAHEQQGNSAKAKSYRDTLAKAFPKSPVTLTMQMSNTSQERNSHARPASSAPTEEIPAYEEEEAAPSGEASE